MGRVSTYGTYGTETAAILIDRLYKADGSKRAVIFCHGLNGQPWNPVNFPDPVIDEMVKRKFPVISPALGGPAVWGNDTSQTKITDAKNYLQASVGAKAGGSLLYCGSMGTLAGLNYIRNNGANVAAVAVALPAVNLQDLHDNAVARGITAASIESAYTDLAGYNAARTAHNPAENTPAYISVATKIKLWYSNDDTTVIPSVVQAFAASTGVSAINMGNSGGHVFNTAYTRDVADFLESFN